MPFVGLCRTSERRTVRRDLRESGADTIHPIPPHAKLTGKSVSALVRECIEQSPTVQEPTENGPSLYNLAKDLCGCFDSGVTDLSTNPKHLKGFGEWRR